MYWEIPQIKNQRYAITQIKFNDVILVIDPNDPEQMTYQDTLEKCEENNIEFQNQTFPTFVQELKDRFIGKKSQSKIFTEKERHYIINSNLAVMYQWWGQFTNFMQGLPFREDSGRERNRL